MSLSGLCLLAVLTVGHADGNAAFFEDRFSTTEQWDLLDMKGDAHIAIAEDATAPPGYGPSVLSIEGDYVIGLAKGVHLDSGTILVLYRERDPRGKDADGLPVCRAAYGDSVSEEHNTKQVRPHAWFEQDNDSGLQFRSYAPDGTEPLLAEWAGEGLITEDWNETNWIWQKVRFDGNRLRGKYWPAHSPEPGDWALEAEYDDATGDRVGFRLGSASVHIAYFAVAEDNVAVAPPGYWLVPKQEFIPETALPTFTLYTNGSARVVPARWFLTYGEHGNVWQQELDIPAGPDALSVHTVAPDTGVGEDGAVCLVLTPDVLRPEMTFSLRNADGAVLAEARVRQVDTQHLRQRIKALEAILPDPPQTPGAEAASALLARARSLIAASDFTAAERSLAYAEEYRGADNETLVATAKTAARPFGPPLAAASIETRGGQIFVNGEPFIVKGVNVHSLDASSKERTRRMLQILKDRGFNMLRGDFPPRWEVDMAHEMGMAWSVLAPFSCCSTDEIFARREGPPMTTAQAVTAAFIDDYVDSPGVLMWNSCNEIGNDTADFLAAMYPVYRYRDPYRRPVHYANLYGQDRWEGQDIMAINYYFGKGQTPEDRQPIIQRSIDIAREHGLPVIYTEYNSYCGPIPETGVQAIYGMFQWGLEQGMSGGFFYMKNDSKDHPGVFNDQLETHPEMDAAFIDVFADARLDTITREKDALRLRLVNKRPFTLREVRLRGTIGAVPFAEQALDDFPPHDARDVDVLMPEETKPEAAFEGHLEFVTHYSFPCRVPLQHAGTADARVPFYADKANLLVYADETGALQPVESIDDWQRRRAHTVANMERVMGAFPNDDRRVSLDVEVIAEEEFPLYVRRTISYAAEQGDRVPAYLLTPKKLEGKAPAVLALHPTYMGGKDMVVGLGDKPNRNYGQELAERGYVVLAPDYITFGDYTEVDPYALGYASGTMKGIWNHVRAVDLLASLDEVDADRIGCIGHSLGGHNTLFLGVFDPRVKAMVTSCGFNAFPKYYGGDLTGWTSDRYMPRIRTQFDKDPAKMPFDFTEILAALAPRPLFISAPIDDANFEVSGVYDCLEAARPVYALFDASDRLAARHPDCAHDFPSEIRELAYDFLDQALKGNG